jgi:hypothetical protein
MTTQPQAFWVNVTRSSRRATSELVQRPLPATTTREVNRDADHHRPRSNGDPTRHSSHPERLLDDPVGLRRSQCVVSRFTDTARKPPPRTVTRGGDGVSVGGLAMHGDQLVCQTQFFPRQLAVVKPPRWPTGCVQWGGGHRQESASASQPLRRHRQREVALRAETARSTTGPWASRRRAGVSKEGGPGCEIADTFPEGDAQADVSTARLSAA